MPRAAFGRTKKAVTQPLWLTESLQDVFSPTSFPEFAQFVASVPLFNDAAESARFRVMRALYEVNLRINWRLQSLGKALGFRVNEKPLIDERYSRDRGPSMLTFHWGVRRMMRRYKRKRANA